MKKKITAISFGDSVKRWSYDQFIARFQPIYPDADLKAYAKELGLAIVREKPAGGRRKSAAGKCAHDQDITTAEPDSPYQRENVGTGEHEADQEGLR